jgi:hypothetical protein
MFLYQTSSGLAAASHVRTDGGLAGHSVRLRQTPISWTSATFSQQSAAAYSSIRCCSAARSASVRCHARWLAFQLMGGPESTH